MDRTDIKILGILQEEGRLVDFLDLDLAFFVHPKILVTRSMPPTKASTSPLLL